MRKSQQKRPKLNFPENAKVEDFARAWFDTLMARPGAAKACKELADDRNLPVDVIMYEAIAAIYHAHGKSLPSEVRDYIIKHDPDRPDAINELLKPGLH